MRTRASIATEILEAPEKRRLQRKQKELEDLLRIEGHDRPDTSSLSEYSARRLTRHQASKERPKSQLIQVVIPARSQILSSTSPSRDIKTTQRPSTKPHEGRKPISNPKPSFGMQERSPKVTYISVSQAKKRLKHVRSITIAIEREVRSGSSPKLLLALKKTLHKLKHSKPGSPRSPECEKKERGPRPHLQTTLLPSNLRLLLQIPFNNLLHRTHNRTLNLHKVSKFPLNRGRFHITSRVRIRIWHLYLSCMHIHHRSAQQS